MASGVRFTKPEREVLKSMLRLIDTADSPSARRAAASALTKIEESEKPREKKVAVGLTVSQAIEAFSGVLGQRLVVPPRPGPVYFVQAANQIAKLGLTRDDCELAAKVAASKWTGRIKAESLFRQADVLMSEAGDIEPFFAGHGGPDDDNFAMDDF